MAQSVKLSNGDYLDTSGIYDTKLKATQDIVNNGDGVVHKFEAKDYLDGVTQGRIHWTRVGKIVYVLLYYIVFSTPKTSKVSLSSLGLPTPLLDTYFECACNGYHTGSGIILTDGNLSISTIATSTWQGTVFGSTVYIAAD